MTLMDQDVSSLARIAFATRHYADLRAGVTRLGVVPWFFAAGAIETFLASQHLPVATRVGTGFLNLFAMTAAAAWTMLRVRQSMDRRFGPVVVMGVEWETIVGFFVFYAAHFVDKNYGADFGTPSFVFLAVTLYALWLAIKLRPYGFHNLLPAAIAFGAALTFTAVPGTIAKDTWVLGAWGSTLLAWLIAGLVDLALLGKLLPPCSSGLEEHHADAI